LGVTVPNAVTYGPLPAIDALAHVAEDYATYAILVCDQDEAELSFVTQGTRDKSVSLESTLYPRKQMQGGWSQRNYQARADERVFHFARAISGEVTRALREDRVDVLVLAGSKVFMNSVLDEFPEEIGNLVAGTIPMDLQQRPPLADIIAATAPVAAKAERKREADAVNSVLDLLGSGRAVAGTVDVLNALQGSQVMTLVVNEDFAEHGWADFSFPVFGSGPIPAEHPTGGEVGNIVEVELEEEFIRLALQQGGKIEIVHTSIPLDTERNETLPRAAGELPRSEPARKLDEVGGVAAILRFVA
jgi:peptide subunit release factor 1 (eRF1)